MWNKLYFKCIILVTGINWECQQKLCMLNIKTRNTLAEVAKWNFFQSKCFPWRIKAWYEKGSVRKWMYFPATWQVKMWPCFFCFSLRNSRGLAPNFKVQPRYGRNPFSSGGSPCCLQNTKAQLKIMYKDVFSGTIRYVKYWC